MRSLIREQWTGPPCRRPATVRSMTFPYPTVDATLTPTDSGKTVHVPLGGWWKSSWPLSLDGQLSLSEPRLKG